MEHQHDMETRLWNYIDGLGDAAERKRIEQLVAEQEVWTRHYNELVSVHQTMKEAETEQPSLRFTRNVMEEIARYHIAPATKKYINNKIVMSIGVFFITLIGGFIIYGMSQIDWSAGESTKGTFGVDLEKIDYSKMFNNTFVNLFMMILIVLGLMLFEKFLNQKKKNFYQPS